jgi:hypothetical protein
VSEAKDKRAPFPFYPLIVAAFPVVSFFSANLAYVPFSQLLRPLLCTVGATALLWALLSLVLRNVVRGAAAATVGILCCFGYAPLVAALGFWSLYSLPMWGIPTAVLMALAAWRLTQTKALNVLSVAIAVVSVANIAYLLGKESLLMARISNEPVAGHRAGVRPDVFYIILDGHGRSDAIKRAIGYGNSSFIEGLKQRGFYVADKSHSNYCQTELSLSSSLNMDFIPNLLPKVKPDEADRAPLGHLIDHNEVGRRFRQEGYGYVSVTTGFPPVRLASADVHLGYEGGQSMIETALIGMTPLSLNQAALTSQVVERRQQLLSAFEDLETLAQPTTVPRLVVAHILAPHPPFVFKADGSSTPLHSWSGFVDGSDFMENVGPPSLYREGYSNQVTFIEKKVLGTIDVLLAAAKPDKPPIIIIQGDHGSKVGLNQNSLAKTDVHEVFPILNAYYVPVEIRKDLRPDISPVNSFRLVLSDLFGEKLPPLPDRSWYSTFPRPYSFTEVTDRIELPSEPSRSAR